MNKTNPSDLAYPSPLAPKEEIGGLTKREIFAKDFTAAILANPNFTNYRNLAEDYVIGCRIVGSQIKIGIQLADTFIQKLNEEKDETNKI